MITCRKTYHDVPFGHRQPFHDGHCSFIHGHNWSITVTFACTERDVNGFVVDYGKLGFLKDWINDNLDHACVFHKDDPLLDQLVNAAPEAWKVYVVDDCSNEGLAIHVYEVFNALVREHTGGRVWVAQVEIEEDSKNAATYAPPAKQ
ncbi:6-pyruvoyl trahydropterin synthase family protein [Cerasicoccus fimbriatus]|uniref:6-pyruvoyl trahydropterin synthase family protein n=1 Tax=Cerasicoccus fimbriatus TaxID=3014554 RepID=UPI0022B31FC8|nr:6-carboxytetrahydropterin synthase [Cerasicoccus sp. TK19100]